jgi:hypothetical protein
VAVAVLDDIMDDDDGGGLFVVALIGKLPNTGLSGFSSLKGGSVQNGGNIGSSSI